MFQKRLAVDKDPQEADGTKLLQLYLLFKVKPELHGSGSSL